MDDLTMIPGLFDCIADYTQVQSDSKWALNDFSADGFCDQTARIELEKKYLPLLEVTDRFNRQSVSFQLSKKDNIHGWLKYKEGFSASLVKTFLQDFNVQEGDYVMDPFMGSGTTALVAVLNGMNAVGYDIMPMSRISIEAKIHILDYNIEELRRMYEIISTTNMPESFSFTVNEVSITRSAYPGDTGRAIEFYTRLIDQSPLSPPSKTLFRLCALNTLEKVSYSAKDGQYLRWDHRCPKVIEAQLARIATGKKPFVVRLDKGEIPSFREVVLGDLERIISDIEDIQGLQPGRKFEGHCKFIPGSSLFLLPQLQSDFISAVVTSPPYCNRYDYTRTYALELAFLGLTDKDIHALRQELLSCTVENKSKIDRLHDFYDSIGRSQDYFKVVKVINDCKPFLEILAALKSRAAHNEINNKGVIKMVEGYFSELAFIFYELFRVCKHGAHLAFVNDNVRYAGEVIPVDFLTTQLAESIGFTPVKIYALKQQKGNSSQQMKKYGRVPLRKSITVWRKP